MKHRAIVVSVATGILVVVGILAFGHYDAPAQVGEKQQVGRQSVADIKAILSHAQPMLGRLGAGRGPAAPAAREPQRPSARPP